MITTGSPQKIVLPAWTRKTEIVDVANGLNCSDMADFPVELSGAVGANLDGTPVVCGGSGSSPNSHSDVCYRFMNGVWEEFASMKNKRSSAAGVVYNKKLHVFGGYNGFSLQTRQTSEIIDVDGVVNDGPGLPTGVWTHAMITINDTVSLLSGGNTDGDQATAHTWYYNHVTEVFTSGPDLLVGRNGHGSAINVDRVTKERIVVVTGGWKKHNRIKINLTEMLINGQWQPGIIQFRKHWSKHCINSSLFYTLGPPLPKEIEEFATLEMHGDVFVFGGRDINLEEQSSIYQLSCFSGLCSWSTLSKQLKVARIKPVAIPVTEGNHQCETTTITSKKFYNHF